MMISIFFMVPKIVKKSDAIGFLRHFFGFADGLFVQSHQELFVVAGLGHAVFEEFHGFHGGHVGEVVAQCPHSGEGAFVDQEVVAAR